MLGTPVEVVFFTMPVAKPDSMVPLIPLIVVAPPVAVLLASPVRAVNTPDPGLTTNCPALHAVDPQV